ncbi:hypothetical protein ACROYT_G030201 [Oculina patagonica]
MSAYCLVVVLLLAACASAIPAKDTPPAGIVHDPVPPVVNYRFPSGKKEPCINGKKTIPAQCQWTGYVILRLGGEPEQLKLNVPDKTAVTYTTECQDSPLETL